MHSGPIRSPFRAPADRAFSPSPLPCPIGLLLALLFSVFSQAPRAQDDRFFQPAEGFTRAKDLSEDFTGTVRSIQTDIKDAFEGSTVHSDAEAWLFDMGNKLHIESRLGTIRRR